MKRRIKTTGAAAAMALAGLLAVLGAPTLAGEETGQPRRVRPMMDDPPRVNLPAGETVFPLTSFGNRPLVELTIGGRGPHRFILDTGAAGSVVDASLAEELELPETGIQHLGSPAGGEPLEVPTVTMKDVRLGGIHIRDLDAAAMDLAGFLHDPEGPRGILAAGVFSGALLSFDYPGGRIVIRPGELPEADGARIFQYSREDGLPTVPLLVAGTAIPAHLDTGSPATFSLPGRYMKSLPLKSEPVERGKARLVDAEITLYAAALAGTVRLGEYVFEDPEIVFGDRFPVGNIGHGLLRRFQVTLDMKNRRIRLDRPEGSGPATPER